MGFRATSSGSPARAGKTPPPDDTHQEATYLKALGENQAPVSIKLMDGEVVRGWIEYYDRRMVRLTRDGAPNLFIFQTRHRLYRRRSGQQTAHYQECE